MHFISYKNIIECRYFVFVKKNTIQFVFFFVYFFFFFLLSEKERLRGRSMWQPCMMSVDWRGRLLEGESAFVLGAVRLLWKCLCLIVASDIWRGFGDCNFIRRQGRVCQSHYRLIRCGVCMIVLANDNCALGPSGVSGVRFLLDQEYCPDFQIF